jgi:transcription antitermination factor NusG
VPVINQTRLHGGRKVVVEEPLFPGYVFLLGSRDEAYLADRTKRVAKIIDVPDQKHLEWEVGNIRLALERSATLQAYPHFIRGRRVEVRAGPFRGLQGVVEDRGRESRLILKVDVLGHALSLEIDGAMLESID